MARRVFDSNSFGKLKLIGALLDAMELIDDGRLAVLYMDEAMLDACGCTHNDTEGLINLPLTAREIQAVVFFKSEPMASRVSMRSKYDVDVRVVATTSAAAATRTPPALPSGQLAEVRPQIIERLVTAIGEGPTAGTQRSSDEAATCSPRSRATRVTIGASRCRARFAARGHRELHRPGNRRARALVVNPVLIAASIPSPAAIAPVDDRRAGRGPCLESDASSTDTGATKQATPASSQNAGNPYSFYGSVGECAFAHKSAMRERLVGGQLRAVAARPTATPSARQLGARPMAAVTSSSASTCARDRDVSSAAPPTTCPAARDTSTRRTISARSRRTPTSSTTPPAAPRLDFCLANIYGAPDGQFPRVVDGGVTPPPRPPRTPRRCSSCAATQLRGEHELQRRSELRRPRRWDAAVDDAGELAVGCAVSVREAAVERGAARRHRRRSRRSPRLTEVARRIDVARTAGRGVGGAALHAHDRECEVRADEEVATPVGLTELGALGVAVGAPRDRLAVARGEELSQRVFWANAHSPTEP